MTVVEAVVLIASLITSVTVISTAVITAYRFIRKWEKWKEEKDKHDIEQYTQILRLVIVSPEMPLSERIAAGDVYVNKLDKNGKVKQKYNELLEIYQSRHQEDI